MRASRMKPRRNCRLIQDRLRMDEDDRARLSEALEAGAARRARADVRARAR